MKKIIRTSNLALRFYLKDGWTKEELDGCCSQGEVNIHTITDEYPYYILDPGASFDTDKLLAITAKVHRAFEDQERYSDKELIVLLG